jgi:putative copper export protein/methionine-rich copper-binding protein CopC
MKALKRLFPPRLTSRIVSAWISALLLLVLLAPRPVAAHGYIVRSIPEDRAALERAPARVQYWFSESLEPDFSSITVRDSAGTVVATGGVDERNAALMSARLPTDLPEGAYIAELRLAFASDGHVLVETRVFFVGQASDGVTGVLSSDLPVPLEIVWRAALLSSSTLLLGLFGLYALVLVPAWGNPAHKAGLLPPRVMDRLLRLASLALAVAFSANIVALLQQTMVFFGADLGRVLSESLWNVVRIGTRFGDTWNARMLLLLIVAAGLAASVYFRREQPETVRAFWTAGGWVMMLVMGTFSVASHAAGSPVLPWLALISDWLHMLATGFWAGGAAALALILPIALQPYTGEARRAALLAALRRFSGLAAAGLAVVIASGIYNALNWFSEPDDLPTTYGAALLLKLLLVAPLVVIGAAHHAVLRPERYARWSALTRRMIAFVPTLRLEALLVLIVLGAVGLLSATPPPRPTVQEIPPPRAVQTAGEYTLNVTLAPGGPGVNTLDIVVTQNGQPVDDLTVRARMADPSLDMRGAWLDAEGIGDGVYTAADAIDRAGSWWTIVEIGGMRAAFAWDIRAEAAVAQTRDPSLLNLLALGGVLVALGYAIAPSFNRFVARLDLSPTTVTVALGATVATIAVIVVGIWLTAQSGEQYAAQINPPPQVVNNVLPDSQSLARGQAAFASACGWGSGEMAELARRLPRLRDEDLYAAVRDGWRGQPACSLDEAQRWDVVNYLRSLEASGE